MKYNILAAWAKENAASQWTLERIYLENESLVLWLKPRGALVIVLSPRDSFIYFASDYQLSSKSELWGYLGGSKLLLEGISDSDRIIRFKLSSKNIYGEREEYSLLCELMPPKPNVILLRSDGQTVHDALLKYSLSENPNRMVLPNQPYFPPKTSFQAQTDSGDISKIIAQGINNYLALWHRQLLSKPSESQDSQAKLRILNKELKKLNKRLNSQKADLQNAEQADYYYACAEALKPDLAKIKPGQVSIRSVNYLSPGLEEIDIPLFTDKSPQQNLAYYIKKYKKAKSGLSIIRINIQRTTEEIEALKHLIARVEAGENIDLDRGANIGSVQQKYKEQQRLLSLRISEDWEIFIGRKAKENDFISTKLGKAQDWWFHSRIYHGAHVLLRNYKKKEPPAELLEICANLAAWYSQAKFSVNVPVDYTQVRYLRKPKGSPAGYISYTNFKSIFANPKDLRTIKSELGI
ncbi:MAG: NFACT RNA binding domain-containing protein [Candidatus Cloacimonetes bacterium]|nr:NFACT RNA binding domain-containing protein [Candidatus Cloacimonadota bacterium]